LIILKYRYSGNNAIEFVLEDLPYLKYRFYLRGTNSPHDPWYLSQEIPAEKRHRIDDEKFKQFVTVKNYSH